MNLFNHKSDDTASTEIKKKPRGKPFTGKGDPRNNLSGRPKLGRTLAAKYRDALGEAESEARGGKYSKLDAMIDILIEKAMEGDIDAIKYLQERGFGKVPDRLELSKAEMGDEQEDRYDFNLLTLDERMTLFQLLGKATVGEKSRITNILPYVDGTVKE